MKEVWKDIKGYEGLYQISDKGRVRACETTREVRDVVRNRHDRVGITEYWTRRERILKPIQLRSKHAIYVHLYKNDHTRESIAIKRLVASHFMKDFSDDIKTNRIRYKDSDPSNCSLSNLYII